MEDKELDTMYESFAAAVNSNSVLKTMNIDKKIFRITFLNLEKHNALALQNCFQDMLDWTSKAKTALKCQICGNVLAETGTGLGHKRDLKYFLCFSCGQAYSSIFSKIKQPSNKTLKKNHNPVFGVLVE